MLLRKTIVKEPDIIEFILIGILAIWTISEMLLIKQAVSASGFNIASWTSLTTFFVGFISIVILVIAVIVADIRKELVSKR